MADYTGITKYGYSFYGEKPENKNGMWELRKNCTKCEVTENNYINGSSKPSNSSFSLFWADVFGEDVKTIITRDYSEPNGKRSYQTVVTINPDGSKSQVWTFTGANGLRTTLYDKERNGTFERMSQQIDEGHQVRVINWFDRDQDGVYDDATESITPIRYNGDVPQYMHGQERIKKYKF
ncbi:MAG: hypothetical protein E7Z87_07500 [Cyanobacteria bacterium SIG26]|nr:hypothetical protein [Cyanobacteria bacterium SIG26]